MLQVNLPNPNGPGHVWSSPERDIAHALPQYVYTAMQCVRKEIEGMPEDRQDAMFENARRYLVAIKRFMSEAVTTDNQADLVQESGLRNIQADARALVDKWLARAVFGAYYSGVRAACHASAEEYHEPQSVTNLTRDFNPKG